MSSGLLLDSVLSGKEQSGSCFLLGGKYPLRREAKLRLSRGGLTFGGKENRQLSSHQNHLCFTTDILFYRSADGSHTLTSIDTQDGGVGWMDRRQAGLTAECWPKPLPLTLSFILFLSGSCTTLCLMRLCCSARETKTLDLGLERWLST